MNARPHLIIALTLAISACGTATSEPEGPSIPAVKTSELERQIVPGPSLGCDAEGGELHCSLAVAPGFRVEMLSVLIQGDDHLEEVAFLGDADIALLTGARTHVATLPSGGVDLDVQIHYTADALESPGGTEQSEAAVRCQVQLGDASNLICEAGDYERWNAFLVPDTDLVREWEDRTFGTPSVQTTIVTEADDDRVCFREYPRCEPEGVLEQWSEVATNDGVPDSVRYGFMLPAESAHSEVTITTNVMYDPAPIAGPGIYIVSADGDVVRH